MLKRLPRGDDVRNGFALGNGSQELSAGLVESDRSREGETLAEQVLRVRRVCGDLIAPLAYLVCRDLDPLDGFLVARICLNLLHNVLCLSAAPIISQLSIPQAKNPFSKIGNKSLP